MRVEKSVEIKAPPEKIWPLLIEPKKVLEWYIPLRRFEYTGKQKGGEGAPLYFEEKVVGQLMKLNCVVTECVENKSFAFKMTSGSMMKSYEERWTLEKTPNGSKFTFVEQGELPYGFFGKVIEPIAERMSGLTLNKMLAELNSMAAG